VPFEFLYGLLSMEEFFFRGRQLTWLWRRYKMGLEGLRDSYFTSFFAAPYLGLLTNFASCVFVVGIVWGIFVW